MGVSNNDWSGSRGASAARCAVLFAVQREHARSCQTTEQLSGTLVGFLGERQTRNSFHWLNQAFVCGSEAHTSWEAEQSIGRIWLWVCSIYGLNRTLSTPVCPLFPFITVTAAPDRVQSASADSHRRNDLSCNLSKMSHRHMLTDLFMRPRKPAKCK